MKKLIKLLTGLGFIIIIPTLLIAQPQPSDPSVGGGAVGNGPLGGPTPTGVADFSAEPTSGTAPLIVQFTDLSFGTPISWHWDFDNNGTIDSEEQNPEWTYNEAGTYSVSLTVSDGTNNDTETKVDYITVSEGPQPCPGIPTVTYEGQVYNTVLIGNQCWLKENLNIGTMINGTEEMTDNGVIEKYCYDNDPANCDEYGSLYQWDEMMQYTTTQGVQGICPTSWHLPTDDEVTVLTDFLGGISVAGGKMKEIGTTHWYPPNTGATNESGFTALPGGAGGAGGASGNFGSLSINCYFWSSSEFNTNTIYAFYRELAYSHGHVTTGVKSKDSYCSSRCLKDETPQQEKTVTTEANPPEGGTTAGDGTYLEGTEVTVNAYPNTDWEFINWTVEGVEVSIEAEYTFFVTEDVLLLANFEYLPPLAPILISATPGIEEITLVWEAIPENNKTGHFNFVGGIASNPVWTIYIGGARVNGINLEADDEIAIFDGELMVGVFVLTQVCTPSNQLENAVAAFSTLTSGPGYTPGNSYSFKAWSESTQEQYNDCEITLSDPYGVAWTGLVFPEGDGQYSMVELDFGSEPTQTLFNIYYGDGTLVAAYDEGLTYTDMYLTGGEEYCYYVTQILEGGLESYPSSVLCATPFASQNGIISGIVTELETDNPIEGAIVVVEGTTFSAITIADGTYIIEDVNAGIYDIIAYAEGYYTQTINDVQVISGETITVNFSLNPEGVHFQFEGGNAADPVWTIYLSTAIFDDLDLQANDEIGIFDGETLVGTYVLSEVLTPETMFENALNAFATLTFGPGYTVGNPVIFKCWDASQNVECAYCIPIFTDPYGGAWTELTFPPGDGQYSIADLIFNTGGTVSGTISLDGGTGVVTNAEITIGEVTVNPNEYGFYEITGVEPGPHQVYAELEAYYGDVQTAEVVAGETTTIDFILNPEIGNITGTITDEQTSAPLEGVYVNLEGTEYEAFTDSYGTYQIFDVLIGQYTVNASLENYFPESIQSVLVVVDETTIVDVALWPEPGTISGTITLNGGPGILTNVEIIVNETTTYPDEYGYYEVNGLDPDLYEVNISLDAYYSETISGVEVISNVVTTLDVTLNPEIGIIAGTIIDELSSNPLEGVYVDVEGTEYEAFTGLDGTYEILDVLIGNYTVNAILLNYFPESVQNVEVIVDETTIVDFVLIPEPGSIAGTITDDYSGLPIEGAVISVEGTSLSAISGSDGYYLIENIVIGTYLLNIEALNYYQEFISEIEVFSNETTIVDFSLTPEPGLLQGYVTDDVTLLPIEGALVSIDDFDYSAYTNSDGMYLIEEIPVGIYAVNVSAENYFESIAYDIEIYSNLTTFLDFNLHAEPGSIEGYITDFLSGEPIEGVEISVDELYFATTNSSGYYLIEDVEVGVYNLNAEIEGYYPEEEINNSVYSNQITEVNFILHPIHFVFQTGNPANPFWTIYLSEGTLDELDLQVYDELAIFDGDILVGEYTLTEVLTPENQFNNALLAWSILYNGEIGYTPGNEYSLKCWDASEGVEASTYNITFLDPNGYAYIGDVFPTGDDQYSIININFTGTIIQNYPLQSGYQIISSRAIIENPDMATVCNEVLDNLVFVRNSYGSMLRKTGPVWINGIGDWITTEGYLVRMSNNDIMEIEGLEIDPQTPIPLVYGYKIISYLQGNPMDALVAFNDILDNLDFVRNTAGNMLQKIGPNWVNGIGNLNSDEGYLIRMLDSDVLVYPETDVKYTGVANIKSEYFNFKGGNATDPVFTIYIDGLDIGDEVAAYDGDVLVGAMNINSQNTFDNDLPMFSTINGGQGYKADKSIILKVWDASTQSLIPFEYLYADPYNEAYMEQVYPSKDGLYSVIKITKGIYVIGTDNKSVSIFPNPSEGIFNISIEGVSGEIHLKIFDVHGNSNRFFEIEGTNNIISKKLDLKELATGVYFISFIGKDFIRVKKIVIQ